MSENVEGALVKIVDAARKIGVSRRHLEREIVRGRFPRPLKSGRLSLVLVEEITAYVDLLKREREQRTL